MTVAIDNKEALRTWLTDTLSPICDADPLSLAKYVVALITKKERSEKELRKLCSEQLEVFLQRDTERFIDKLFSAIKYKDYIPSTKKSSSRGDRSPRDRSPRENRRRSRSRDRSRRSPRRDRRRRTRSRDRRSYVELLLM